MVEQIQRLVLTVECEISSESGSESTISFAPGYVSVLDKWRRTC